MCCGSNTQTTVTTPDVPDWLEDYYQYQTAAQKELYDTARDIYRERQDFPLYTEPRIQDFTTDQMGSFNLIRDNIGVADPSLEAAVARNTQGGRTFADVGGTNYAAGSTIAPTTMTTAGLAPYESMYREGVIDDTLVDMRQEYERQNLARQGAAQRAGAFGGSRHGLMDAMAQEDYLDSVGQVTGQLRDQGFNTAMGAFQRDQDLGLRGEVAQEEANRAAGALNRATFQTDQERLLRSGALAGDLAGLQQQSLLTDATALQAQGAQQQGFGQLGLDLAREDELIQQQYPYGQLGFLQSAMTATPFNPAIFTGQTTTAPGPSTLGQIAGAGLTGIGLLSGGPGLAANSSSLFGGISSLVR